MEYISLLTPFLLAGLVASIVSRYTGVAISFLMAPAVLALGATPVELIVYMLTFLVYTNFTQETQEARLDFKNLRLFGGYRKYLLVLAAVVVALFAPFIAVAGFVFCLVLELAAVVYQREEPSKRPAGKALLLYGIWMSVAISVGVLLLPFLPETTYFIWVGLGILFLTGLAWYFGRHREAFATTWDGVWASISFLTGLLGLDATIYRKGLMRHWGRDPLGRLFGIVQMFALFVGLVAAMYVYNLASLPALVGAIGAGLGTRIVSVYGYNNQEGVPWLALGTGVFIAMLLLLAAPHVVGFGAIEEAMKQHVH